MYRFSQELDLSNIVGCELNQVCLGGYDVQFVFDSKTTIVVASRVSLFEHNELVATWNPDINWSDLRFQSLLNTVVLGYSVINDQTLEIRFANNFSLRLYDESDQFESLQIYFKGDSDSPIVI
jgi:hypothetical protein